MRRRQVGQQLRNGILVVAVAAAAPALARAADAPKPEKRWGLTTIADISSNLKEWGTPTSEVSTGLWLIPSYKLSSKFSAGVVFIVAKDLTGERKLSLARSDLTSSWTGIQLNPFLKLTAAGSVRLPLAKDARSRQSLITSVRLAPRLNFDLERAGLRGVTGFYEIAGVRYFHEYDTTTEGRSNSKWANSHWLSASYAFTDKLSFSSAFIWTAAWTYSGNQKNTFKFDEALDYQINEKLGVGIGISNEGNPLKANGQDSNIALIDGQTSSVYGSVTYVF